MAAATIPCRRPASCGTTAHKAGTAAAAACAMDAPGLPRAGWAAIASVRPARLRDKTNFAAANRNLKAPDPTGGYTRVLTRYFSDGRVSVLYGATSPTTGRDVSHRADGPAKIDLDASGRVESMEWHRDGYPHREDGPARTANPVARYMLEGAAVGGASDDDYVEDLVATGADPTTVVRWLRASPDREAALEMVASGVDVVAYEKALGAGIEPGQAAAVARGELPVSWASAGLQSGVGASRVRRP